MDKYPIVESQLQMMFSFFSEGPNGTIEKVVTFTEIDTPGVYNLSLGDKDKFTGEVNDLVISNNGDTVVPGQEPDYTG